MARKLARASHKPGHSSALVLPEADEYQSAVRLPRDRHDPLSKNYRNPFAMPPETELFAYRDGELRERRKERQEKRDRNRSLHERSTASRTIALRNRRVIEDLDDQKAGRLQPAITDVQPTALDMIAQTKDRRLDKERLAEFVAKKREMFLLQYSLNVKREEIAKLEEMARKEEKKLDRAERSLRNDNSLFDEFLKETDKKAVDAVKHAEAKTREKLEKMAETKRTTAQIMALKSEISKNEEQLKLYISYWKFLYHLAPAEWRAEQATKRAERRSKFWPQDKQGHSSASLGSGSSVGIASSVDLEEKSVKGSRAGSKSSSRMTASEQQEQSSKGVLSASSVAGSSVTSMADDLPNDIDSDEEIELYFTIPQQLLDIYTKLEEQNLSLIQNSQETEEALEAIKQTRQSTEEHMNLELESLRRQIASLENDILEERAKANDLQVKTKLFSHGEFQADEQEALLQSLNTKVGEVYHRCIGDNEAGVSALQMLTTIENRLEELFEKIEAMPPDRIREAEKSKEKERRERARQEKLEAQRQHQEVRMRKALERARADPKKHTGRRLVFRSAPPQTKQRKDDEMSAMDKEQEEMQYYFS